MNAAGHKHSLYENRTDVPDRWMNPKNLALLLEDEAIIAMDLEITLQAAGFDVVTLLSCSDANAWLRGHTPSVAIVDVQLTDGSCHDVVAKLHAAGVPFIVHSGEHASLFSESVFAKGTWMGKPSHTNDLVLTARELVRID
jgi:DNA-binding response OmpR family regulator